MTKHFELCAARTELGFVVRVQGRGTSAHSPALADFVLGCFEQEPDARVAVDLLQCDYLDSTFLGCLLKLQRAGSETRFQVVADDAAKARLLAATHLNSYLTVVPGAPKSTTPFLQIDARPLSQRELGQHIMESHQALSEVPSDFAAQFRKIAGQLMIELSEQEGDTQSMEDTIAMPTPIRRV
jgi:anti-anti-sigma factor